MSLHFEGRCWKFGDNIDIDMICPTKYAHISDEKELAEHCMAEIDPDFPNKVNDGDILVAGKNFGYGLGHWNVVRSVVQCGISAVIAESFGRSFYRPSVEFGLPPITCSGITSLCTTGDVLDVFVTEDVIEIHNQTTEQNKSVESFSSQDWDILTSGGLLPYLKMQLS